MRREGRRQHGIFRTYRILPPPLNPRLVNSLTSSPTNGLFTRSHRKVLSGQVHWVRSNDIASSSYKLLTWQVLTGPGPVLNPLPDSEVKDEVEMMNTENNEDNKSEKEDGASHDDNDYDESMSFYDVGMMMMMEHVLDDDEEEEEDGWCLV